ncbi:MAG: hypothetical protein HUU50_16805 [Candidatus Brocadiae bacterium]|nr:hypothetical protein [Candidatus Brocadiia bacterium]
MKLHYFANKEKLKKIFPYLLLFFFALVLASFVLQIYGQDLNIPFYYLTEGTKFPYLNFDVNLYLAVTKNISEGGWLGEFPRLGAPGVLSMQDYPFAYFQQHSYILIKLFILAGASYGMAINLFFLVTFSLIAIAAFYFFKLQNISTMVSACCSILFAFLPYHIHTGQMHLALSFYFAIPLSMAIAFWIAEDKYFKTKEGKTIKQLDFSKIVLSLIFLFFISSSDVYYVFYAAFIFFFSGLIASHHKKNLKPFFTGIIACSFLLAFVILFLIPVWIHKLQCSPIEAIIDRHWTHSEFWGLKTIQLLLPIRFHILEAFSGIADSYGIYPHCHVNEAVALGLIGSLGFLSLLVWQIFPRPIENSLDQKVLLVSKLNLLSLLCASIGGFFTVFSFFLYPFLRANYRVGIYIAFFSLFAIAFLLEKWKTCSFWQQHKKLFPVFLFFITILGTIDQNGTLAVPEYRKIQAAYCNHKDYFSSLEELLPKGSLVFQLPYASFPEGGDVHRIQMYEQFIPFLHTKQLKWSYGAVKNREIDIWLKEISQKDILSMTKELNSKGFSAILIDTYGIKKMDLDNILSDLKKLSLPLLAISQDKRFITFKLLP